MFNVMRYNQIVLGQLGEGSLKLLTDAGAVGSLAVALVIFVIILNGLVRAFISVMKDYNSALVESNKQTALMREALEKINEQQSGIMKINNDTTEKVYSKVIALKRQTSRQHNEIMSALNTIQGKLSINISINKETSNEEISTDHLASGSADYANSDPGPGLDGSSDSGSDVQSDTITPAAG